MDIKVRGNYQDSMDVVRAFVTNKAIDKKATMAKADDFANLISSKRIKEHFQAYVKDLKTPIKLQGEDKILGKHLHNMYSKSVSGEFSKDNLKSLATAEAASLNQGQVHPSLLQKNEKIKALNTELNTAKETIITLTGENKQLKTENKGLKLSLDDAKEKFQNLAGNVMKTFGTSKDQVTKMSETKVDLKTDQKLIKSNTKKGEISI